MRAPNPIPEALTSLYEAQAKLASAYPEHTFTLDGKIVGDIGEAIAASIFHLKKLRAGERDHDFQAPDGRLIQVKATQKAKASRGVGLGLIKREFQVLVVIEFDRNGEFEILYNGPGKYIDALRNHKKSASLSRLQLRKGQLEVKPGESLELNSPVQQAQPVANTL